MAAALLSLAGPYIPLGVVTGIAVLCAVNWAVRRCRDGAKEEGGGGVSSATGKHEGLLNKNKDVVVAVTKPGDGGGQQRAPDPGGDGDVELCAICKARLAEAGWGGCRRLRPCGHVYHADCIDLWLQRRWICPVCRAGVVGSPTEIMDAMVWPAPPGASVRGDRKVRGTGCVRGRAGAAPASGVRGPVLTCSCVRWAQAN